MEIRHQFEAIRRENASTCVVWEYPTTEPLIDGVVVDIDGRYPEFAQAENLVSTMVAYVLEGEGIFAHCGEEHSISAFDLLVIPPRMPYFWKGSLHLFVASTPKWTPEQHKVYP